jgi:hypothetical protein
MNKTLSPADNQVPENAPVFVTFLDAAFERELMDRLSRVEAKLDTLVGNGQPGRMRIAEEKIAILERDNVRRTVYDRILNGMIAIVVSAAIALHDHLGLK